MTGEYSFVPPGQLWLPVWDLSSALDALNDLLDYIKCYDGNYYAASTDEI